LRWCSKQDADSSNLQTLGTQAAVKLAGGNAIPKPRYITPWDLAGIALQHSQERLHPLAHDMRKHPRSTNFTYAMETSSWLNEPTPASMGIAILGKR
jgi:hypothetical protein